jgi:hypothetical protein
MSCCSTIDLTDVVVCCRKDRGEAAGKCAYDSCPADDVVFDLTGNVYDSGGNWLGSLTAGGKWHMATKKQVFAILRYDGFQPPSTPIENLVTVTSVAPGELQARAEAARLNELNGEKGCTYFVQATKLLEDSGKH